MTELLDTAAIVVRLEQWARAADQLFLFDREAVDDRELDHYRFCGWLRRLSGAPLPLRVTWTQADAVAWSITDGTGRH